VSDDDRLEAARRYYDAFAARYDDARGGRVPGGYHDLVDELELGFVARYAAGGEVLEVGCGTGLLLERMRGFAARARGVDLSPAMLARARARGLDVVEGSVTALPFADATFDVACAFKVLAHVHDLQAALCEMARVVRPGGFVVAELYNAHSLRWLVRRLAPPRSVAEGTTEAEIHTRYDTPDALTRVLPPETRVVATRGVRIVTPFAAVLRMPVVGALFRAAERRLCDGPLARFGGFWIAALEKN
jgi:ubiquinone/menaquinone biosynthesis C-methylase UbiE